MEAIVKLSNTVTADLRGNINSVISYFAAAQDVAQSSRNLYARTLQLFFNWVENSGRSINILTVADLIEYKNELLNNGKSTLTVAGYVNSLRRFYEWTEANKIYPNIGKGLHAPKRVQQFRKQPLNKTQVNELLQFEYSNNPRDYAIINLIVRTGLRCIEVVRANVEDITYKGGKRVLMVQGKGREEKDNFVILTDAAYNPIKDYLQTRDNPQGNAPLFTSTSNRNYNGRMTTRAVSGIAKKGLINVGLEDKSYTAHSLRHTAAVNTLRAGGSLEQVQYMLRHTNPATTQIYTATFREEQRINNAAEMLLESFYTVYNS